MGDFTVYVGLNKEEAVERYKREEGEIMDYYEIREFEVKDNKFYAYNIW